MTNDPRKRREGGRPRRSASDALPQLPWKRVRNPYAPMEILSADQVEVIHHTSLRILAELGIELMSPRARELMRAYRRGDERSDGHRAPRRGARGTCAGGDARLVHADTTQSAQQRDARRRSPGIRPRRRPAQRARLQARTPSRQLQRLLRFHPARPVLQCRAPDRQPGLCARRIAGRHAAPRYLPRQPRVLGPLISLHGHRRWSRPRRHRDDGNLPRHVARGDGVEPRRHHHHLRQ